MWNQQTKTHTLYLLCYNHKDTKNNKIITATATTNNDYDNYDADKTQKQWWWSSNDGIGTWIKVVIGTNKSYNSHMSYNRPVLH